MLEDRLRAQVEQLKSLVEKTKRLIDAAESFTPLLTHKVRGVTRAGMLNLLPTKIVERIYESTLYIPMGGVIHDETRSTHVVPIGTEEEARRALRKNLPEFTDKDILNQIILHCDALLCGRESLNEDEIRKLHEYCEKTYKDSEAICAERTNLADTYLTPLARRSR